MSAAWILMLTAGKAGVLLAFASLAARILRRSSAALGHSVLFLGFAGALVIPLLQAVLPGWPASFASGGGEPGAPSGFAPVAGAVWLAGAVLLLARLGVGLRAGRRFVRETLETGDARLLSLAIEARSELGFRAPLRMHLADRDTVPMSYGILNHRVILPRDATRWPRSRLRAVLLHELSHLARRDCLTQLIAEICRAVFWFLPFAWWNARDMRFLREVASDDRVLSRGARPSRYAAFLLRAQRRDTSPVHSLAGAAALGGEHELMGRIRAILARGPRSSRAGAGKVVALAATVLLTACLAGFGAAEVSAAPTDPRSPNCGHSHCGDPESVVFVRSSASGRAHGTSVSVTITTR